MVLDTRNLEMQVTNLDVINSIRDTITSESDRRLLLGAVIISTPMYESFPQALNWNVLEDIVYKSTVAKTIRNRLQNVIRNPQCMASIVDESLEKMNSNRYTTPPSHNGPEILYLTSLKVVTRFDQEQQKSVLREIGKETEQFIGKLYANRGFTTDNTKRTESQSAKYLRAEYDFFARAANEVCKKFRGYG